MLVDKNKIISLMFNGVEVVGELKGIVGDKIEVKMPLGLVTNHQGNLQFVEFMLCQQPESVVTFPANATAYMIGDSVNAMVSDLYTATITAIMQQEESEQSMIDTSKPRIQV